MAHIEIIIGSTLGGAEYVAEHLSEKLQAAQHQTTLHYQPELTTLFDTKTQDTIWLVVTSTHGAGDVPDNLRPFADALALKNPPLPDLRYAIVAIGDSNYDTFCGAGRTLDHLLEQCAAQKIGTGIEIDVTEQTLPEDAADVWFETWIAQLK